MYMGNGSIMVLVLLYFPICLFILWLINRALKNACVKAIKSRVILFSIASIMFFFATWDAILGKYYLDKFCEADGGTYINTNKRIEGRYLAYKPRPETAVSLLNKGYSFIEMGKDENYVRYTFDENKTLKDVQITELTSRVVKDGKHTKVGPDYLNITMSNSYLMDKYSKKILGGYRNFLVYTNLDKTLGGIGAIGGTRCTDISRFKDQERFSLDHNFDYEYILVNLNRHGGSK